MIDMVFLRNSMIKEFFMNSSMIDMVFLRNSMIKEFFMNSSMIGMVFLENGMIREFFMNNSMGMFTWQPWVVVFVLKRVQSAHMSAVSCFHSMSSTR